MRSKVLVALVLGGTIYGQAVEAGPYTLEWNAVQGATAYRVYQSTDQAVTWQKIYDGPLTTFTVNIAGSGTFLFQVSAVKGDLESRTQDKGAWAIPSLAPYSGQLKVQ